MIREYDMATDSPDQIVHVLSGGNLQKVIFGARTGCQPEVRDSQPTHPRPGCGRDRYVHRRLLDLRQSGAGILLISEDLDEIFTLSDRIAVMYKGQMMGIFQTGDVTREEIGLLMAGICERVEHE